MKYSLRLLLGSLLIGASMLPARGMEAPAAPDAAAHGTEAEASAPVEEAPHEPSPAALAEGRDTHWSDSRPPMPFDVMRSVQFLQDQVARGNVRAIRVQALLLRRFGRTFLEADPAVWTDPRNARAAILFTLSGGTPEVLERLVRDNRFPEVDRSLYEGALDYVRNDLEAAAKKFDAVAIDTLEPVLGAQVSLALGQIRQFEHPEQAVENLARARLLAPGTLIEEAALRLGAPLVNARGDYGAADQLARRYFDAYRESSYVANFETRYVAMVVGRAIASAQEALLSMDAVVASLSTERRQRLYLAAARRSLVSGNLAFSAASAERAIGLGGLEPGDEARATLYRTAAALGENGPDASLATLDGIDRAMLHVEDQKLLDAAYSVLASMAKPALLSEAKDLQLQTSDASPVLSRAREALEAASSEIKKSQP